MIKHLLLAAALLVTPAAAHAEWREAETPHFVIWSDSSEGELRKFAERLEGVDQLMRKATAPKEGMPVHKVRVFLVGDVGAVQRAYGGKQTNVAGFYTVNEAGPMAVSPRRTGTDSAVFSADVVLAHEYGHHFMLQYLPNTYPSWYVEGFAELFSTAAPIGGGKFAYGKAASHRGYSLTGSRWLPIGKLMTAAYGELSSEDFDFYGQSWLLTHYLTFDKTRVTQFKAYLRALRAGEGHQKAATAFGDLNQLNRDLRKYFEAASFSYRPVPIEPIDQAAIKVRSLTAGEAGLVNETISMRDDIGEKEADAWLAAIRAKTARFGNDRYALQLRADAEYVAEEYASSISSADKVLAVAPGDHRALVRKALAQLRIADELKGEAAIAKIKQARGWIAKANRAAQDEPLPYVAYYQSERMMGKVSPLAVDGLVKAVELVPQDDGFRMMLVQQLAEDKRYDEAAFYLGPLAFSPHASGEQKAALKLYEELKKKRTEAAKTSAR